MFSWTKHSKEDRPSSLLTIRFHTRSVILPRVFIHKISLYISSDIHIIIVLKQTKNDLIEREGRWEKGKTGVDGKTVVVLLTIVT